AQAAPRPGGVQTAAFAAGPPALSFNPLRDLLKHFQHLTSTQSGTATRVFGSSLDLSNVFLVDVLGIQNRPFTVVIPANAFGPTLPWVTTYLIMVGAGFSPTTFNLIHELTHVWQSQHHSIPAQYLTNCVDSQALALSLNATEAMTDPTLKANKQWPAQFPFSPYAFVRPPPKAFGDYAAEQIAQQVARG